MQTESRHPWRMLALCAALALSACASAPPAPSPSPSSSPATAPAPVAVPAPVANTPAPVPVAPPAVVRPAPTTAPAAPEPVEGAALEALLAYADRVRALGPSELTTEILNLGEPGASAQRQMQLALALTHTHLPVDTARALGLMQRVAGSNSAEAAPLKPLARLLSARLLEQRRLEDSVDKLNQQLRESQRRIDQLSDRLEAMRAIERSINNRAPARPAAP